MTRARPLATRPTPLTDHPVTGLLRPVALLALLLAAPVALAAPKDEARRHFNMGIEYIAAGDYERGIAEFKLANEILPHPVVLYNIARAYADIQDYENAILYFEEYLLTNPIDRAEVESYINTMRARQEAKLAPPPVEGGGGGSTSGGARPVGPVATADELAELQRHALELQALATRLAEREQALAEAAEAAEVGGEGGEGGEGGGGEVAGAEVGAGDAPLALSEKGLVEDLYARVVVTASRFAQDPLTAPAAVTIISQDDIRMSTASTVAELLQTVPGLDMMQLTASNPEVSIRGFNQRLSNKVLVLVDGRTVYMDFIGSTLWSALPLTLEDIERIEIIRGPGSAIYGANAFGGVINIITRAPGDVSQQNQVSVAGGSAGLARGSVNLAGRDDRLAWKTTAGVQQLGRWSQDADPSRVDVGSPYGDNPNSVQSATASAMLQWQLSEKGFVSVSGGVNDGLSEFYSLGALRLFGIDSTSTNARVDLGLGPLYVRSFYNRFGATAQSWYAPTSGEVLGGDILSQAWDTEAQFNESFGANNQHMLTAGVGFRLKTIDWVFLTPGVKVEPHVNGYIQQQSTFGPVTLNGAIRIDRHPLENVGTRPTARLSMVTRVGEGRVIRLNGGNAFRNPTFLESYTDLYLSTGVDGVLVNSMGSEVVRERTDATYRLEPEKIRSIELGFLDQSNDSFRFEVAAYGYQVLDLIDLGSVSAEENQLEFDATKGAYIAGESRFENETPVFWAGGGEVEGAWFGVPGLDVRLNYSFERIVSVAEDGSSTPSNAHPTHKGHAVVAWRSPWDLDVSMTVSAYSAQVWPIRSYDAAGQVAVDLVDVNAYTIVSNKLVWHPFGYDDLDLSASAWNWLALLQGAHTEYPLGQPVGARLYGGVAYRF